ncbi:MAG: RNA methyltransferase [Puniceicoccales bacterium]|jgi:TrmH family RNA methyltransferase|nr:RNA methyltransferase [Puniceicoccales bacterium]
MKAHEVISSRQNPRVQALARLRERGDRRERGVFLVEGFRELSRALASRVEMAEIYFCPALFKNSESHSLLDGAMQRGITLCELGESAFEKVSGREGADGLLGVAKMWDVSLDVLKLPENPLLLVIEAVEKPGNLGALFRTADSAGCSALICCDPVTDAFNPSVVRASQGALFSMPFAVSTVSTVEAFLRDRNVSVFATAPAATEVYWAMDFRGASAILLGSEKDGLSESWLTMANVKKISIPQAGLSDSLNVATAGAICLYEAVRQRSATAR